MALPTSDPYMDVLTILIVSIKGTTPDFHNFIADSVKTHPLKIDMKCNTISMTCFQNQLFMCCCFHFNFQKMFKEAWQASLMFSSDNLFSTSQPGENEFVGSFYQLNFAFKSAYFLNELATFCCYFPYEF